MLYEIGKPCDISAMLMRVSVGDNKVVVSGSIILEPQRKSDSLYMFKIKLKDGEILNIYSVPEDIPHSNIVLVEGEMWNPIKGFISYRSSVEVFANNIVEYRDDSDIGDEFKNNVVLEGTVCMHPVELVSQNRHELVLMSRLTHGEIVRLICNVPADRSVLELDIGKRVRITGKLIQRPLKIRRGKQYIENGTFNLICGEIVT